MSRVRVILADDQAMIRAGLALVLTSEDDIDVVGQCADGSELVTATRVHRPDVVLTDIRMPGVDGIQATTRIKAEPDPPAVLALTTFDDDEVLFPVLTAGADGFVLKDSPAELLVEAVRAVAAGGTWLDARVLPRVVRRAVEGVPAARPDGVLQTLTVREREVLDLLCTGASNTEIAAQVHASERTVKAHVSAILQKFGVRDRAAAIVVAYESGWRRT